MWSQGQGCSLVRVYKVFIQPHNSPSALRCFFLLIHSHLRLFLTSLHSFNSKMRSFAAVVAFASLAFSAVVSALPTPTDQASSGLVDAVCIVMVSLDFSS